MKQWEEIIKDKMEEFDDTLPESVFAEFRARRDGTVHVPKRSRMIWAIVPAVAAGLAAILLLRQPSAPDEEIRIVRQPAVPVAQADIPAEPPVDVPKKAVVSEAVTPQAFVSSSATPKAVVNDAEPAKEAYKHLVTLDHEIKTYCLSGSVLTYPVKRVCRLQELMTIDVVEKYSSAASRIGHPFDYFRSNNS